jgi:hypothetical protein
MEARGVEPLYLDLRSATPRESLENPFRHSLLSKQFSHGRSIPSRRHRTSFCTSLYQNVQSAASWLKISGAKVVPSRNTSA